VKEGIAIVALLFKVAARNPTHGSASRWQAVPGGNVVDRQRKGV